MLNGVLVDQLAVLVSTPAQHPHDIALGIHAQLTAHASLLHATHLAHLLQVLCQAGIAEGYCQQ